MFDPWNAQFLIQIGCIFSFPRLGIILLWMKIRVPVCDHRSKTIFSFKSRSHPAIAVNHFGSQCWTPKCEHIALFRPLKFWSCSRDGLKFFRSVRSFNCMIWHPWFSGFSTPTHPFSASSHTLTLIFIRSQKDPAKKGITPPIPRFSTILPIVEWILFRWFVWVERGDQAIQRCSLAIDANPSNAKAYFRTDPEPLCHDPSKINRAPLRILASSESWCGKIWNNTPISWNGFTLNL